jgi:hypothetical protein
MYFSATEAADFLRTADQEDREADQQQGQHEQEAGR